jgi:hypothetical protein
MPTGMIVCADQGRCEYMKDVEKYDPIRTGRWDHAGSIDEAIDLLVKSRTLHRFILLSMVGEQFSVDDLQRLKAVTRTPVIVELDGDDPQEAFRMLGHGAIHVASRFISRVDKYWDIISKVSSGQHQPISSLLLKPTELQRPMKNWGFMCMSYQITILEHSDYYYAIKPTTDRLGLDLNRCDAIPTNESDLLAQVKNAIDERSVLVVHVSSATEWTVFEMGVAVGLGKVVLLLFRESGGERARGAIPRFLIRDRLVKYCTMTELAMKLFFGLGGTDADLRPEDRPQPKL